MGMTKESKSAMVLMAIIMLYMFVHIGPSMLFMTAIIPVLFVKYKIIEKRKAAKRINNPVNTISGQIIEIRTELLRPLDDSKLGYHAPYMIYNVAKVKTFDKEIDVVVSLRQSDYNLSIEYEYNDQDYVLWQNIRIDTRVGPEGYLCEANTFTNYFEF